MMSIEKIKATAESGMLTEQVMLDEIKSRVANNKLLSSLWETGMRVAKSNEERKTVMYMILDCNEECREIFATYLYYQMK